MRLRELKVKSNQRPKKRSESAAVRTNMKKIAYGACTSKRATMTKLTKCTLLSAIVQGEMASKLTKTTAKGSKTSN